MIKQDEKHLLEFMNISAAGVSKVKTTMNQGGCEVLVTKHNKNKKYQMSRKQVEEFKYWLGRL